MRGPDDPRLATLCDRSVPADARLRLAEELLREDGGCITEARRHGLLNATWPAVEAARTIGGSDLFVLSICMPEESVAGVLANAAHEDVERVVLAVRLAAAVTRFDRSAADRFEPLLRAILPDRRPAFPWLKDAPDSVGACAQAHHRTVLAVIGTADAIRHRQLILDTVAASLDRGSQESSLYGIFEDGLKRGLPPARLAQALTDVLGDTAAAPAGRIAARRALDVLDGLARHPDGAPAGMAEAMQQAFERAADCLETILRDERAPEALRRAVEERLHRWAPTTHVRLQREGVIRVVPIPSRRAHKDWTPAGIESLARRVSFDEAVALVSDPKEEQVDRVVTAIRIAPSFAAWLPGAWQQLAPPFVALLSSRIPVPVKSGVRTLADMALEQFAALFPPLDSQTPAMQESLCAGIEAARSAGLDLGRVADWLPNLLSPSSMKRLGVQP